MRTLLLSPEVYSLAKVGGLADVAYALPKALRKLGHDARIAMPKYRWIQDGCREILDISVPFRGGNEEVTIKLKDLDGVPVYLLENQTYFDVETVYTNDRENLLRFSCFCRTVVEMLAHLEFKPEIVHCNDWHTGLFPVYLSIRKKEIARLKDIVTVFTIHNIKYQGTFPKLKLDDINLPETCSDLIENGLINPMKGGILYSDVVSTVSETYAREIQTPEYGCGLDPYLRKRGKTHGIVNGIDYLVWDPSRDNLIYKKYDAANSEKKQDNKLHLLKEVNFTDTKIPLVGMVSRLDVHKGIDLLIDVLPKILKEEKIYFVLLGVPDPKYGGDPKYREPLEKLERDFPENFKAFLKFDEGLAHRIYVGSDIFLMPSLFEPCGLAQLISLRYGTIPVVRKTGGLADTVIDFDRDRKRGNGFVFEKPTSTALERAIRRALAAYRREKVWMRLVERAMREDRSWGRSAREYVELYRKALAGARKGAGK